MSAPLSVGFDLDMTLIDSGPGIGATLHALGEELGVSFPVEEVTALAEQFGIDLTLVDAPVGAPWRVVQAAIDLGVVPLGPPCSPGPLETRTGSGVGVTVS